MIPSPKTSEIRAHFPLRIECGAVVRVCSASALHLRRRRGRGSSCCPRLRHPWRCAGVRLAHPSPPSSRSCRRRRPARSTEHGGRSTEHDTAPRRHPPPPRIRRHAARRQDTTRRPPPSSSAGRDDDDDTQRTRYETRRSATGAGDPKRVRRTEAVCGKLSRASAQYFITVVFAGGCVVIVRCSIVFLSGLAGSIR